MTPTLHTLTNLLNPWRTIRRLEAENLKLDAQAGVLHSLLVTARAKNAAYESSRLRHCSTHGRQQWWAWGCPECVRELRQELGDAQGQLATAKEALRRVAFGGWFENSQFSVDHHARVVEGVADWVRTGMTGLLPPLPERLARREKSDAGEAP